MGKLIHPTRLAMRGPALRPPRYHFDPYLSLFLPMHEGTGSIAEDASIHKNNGTITNASWESAGRIGPCLSFNSSGDSVNCGNDSSLDFGTNDFTISFWLKMDAGASVRNVISKDFASNKSFIVDVPGNDRLRVRIGDGTNIVTSTNDGDFVADSKWHMITITFDRSANMTRCMDGAQIGSVNDISSVGDINVTGDLSLSAPGASLDGLIDEVRIYSRLLSPQEITDLYETTK